MTCEVCNARAAVGTFDLDGVETELCDVCSSTRREDGSVVMTDARDNKHD